MGLGSGIQTKPFPDPGSRGQKMSPDPQHRGWDWGRCLPVPALNFGATRPLAATGGSSLGQNTLAPLRPASALPLPEGRRGGGDGVRSGGADRFLAGVAAAIPVSSVRDP
jgi:hypothetical protein